MTKFLDCFSINHNIFQFLNIVLRYGLFIPKKSDSNKVQLQHKPSIFGDDSDDEVIRISVI